MQERPFWRRDGVAFVALVLCSFMPAAVIGEMAPANTLLIDLSGAGIHGKAYSVTICGKETQARDLFGPAKVKWISLNASGQAACLFESRKDKRGALRMVRLDDTSDGAAREVPEVPDDPRGALSPDGRRLCHRVTEGNTVTIRILHLNSGQSEDVFAIEGLISPVSWSPDGKKIAYYFVPEEEFTDDSYRVSVSGRVGDQWKHKIVAGPSKACMRSAMRDLPPVWGPDGKVIVFEARYQDEERGAQTYLVRIDGTGLVRIAGHNSGPSSSPFHGGIAFSDSRQGVFVYNPNTRKKTKVLDKAGVFYPKFSKNGTLLAYSDSDGVIYVTNADGSSPREIMDTGYPVATRRFHWQGKVLKDEAGDE